MAFWTIFEKSHLVTLITGPDLKVPLFGHVVVAVNSSVLMIIGGCTPGDCDSKMTYYFFDDGSPDGTWIPGPDLKHGRRGHTAGLVTDTITKARGPCAAYTSCKQTAVILKTTDFRNFKNTYVNKQLLFYLQECK